MKNLNHIGAGEKLLNQIQLRNSSTVQHWTRQQQLETYKLQKKLPVVSDIEKNLAVKLILRIINDKTYISNGLAWFRKNIFC